MKGTGKVIFCVTIDTEVDKGPGWRISNPASYRSVTEGIPSLLGPLFAKYGARPTYLLSSEVILDDRSAEALQAEDDCELGTHLHGDVVEPFRRLSKLDGERTFEMQCSYPEEVEYQKLANLTEQFKDRFGYSPKSFRAGRFGAGHNTICSLERLGYAVDSSVSPGLKWAYPEGTADYSKADVQPYYPSPSDICSPGDSSVLEVPVSITRLRPLEWLDRHIRIGSFNPIRAVPDPHIWVRPSHSGATRMKYAIDSIVRDRRHADAIVLNMMFHSMEVIPNASPVTANEAEVRTLLQRIEDVLDLCHRRGYDFATLSEVCQYYPRESLTGGEVESSEAMLPR